MDSMYKRSRQEAGFIQIRPRNNTAQTIVAPCKHKVIWCFITKLQNLILSYFEKTTTFLFDISDFRQIKTRNMYKGFSES